MRNVLIILTVFAGIYAVYYFYTLLQANNSQVQTLQQQLDKSNAALKKQGNADKDLTASLQSVNDTNQYLKTFGGSIDSLFSNIF